MKIVLMVAAGVVAGLTVVLAVVVQLVAFAVQTLIQWVPVLVVLAVAVLMLRLMRRRGGAPAAYAEPWPRYPAMSLPAPVSAPPVLGSVERDQVEPLHLLWGPPVAGNLDLDAAPATISHEPGARVRRERAGTRPAREVRSRRP